MTAGQTRLMITGAVLVGVVLADGGVAALDASLRGTASPNPPAHPLAEFWMMVNTAPLLLAFILTGGRLGGPFPWFWFIIGQCIQWGILGFVLSLLLTMRSSQRRPADAARRGSP